MSKSKKVRTRVREFLLKECHLDYDNLESGVADDEMPVKRVVHSMLMHYRMAKNIKPGFEAVKYKNWFGEWPPRRWKGDPAIVPNLWLRQRLAVEYKSYLDKKGN